MNKPQPPSRHFNDYVLHDGLVWYQTKKGDDLPVMTGLVWIDEPVKCPVSGHLSYLVEIQPFSGERSTLRVTPENMSPKYLKKVLGERGIIIHEDRHLARYLSMTAGFSDYTEKTPRTLMGSPGWFADGKGFYTGRKAIVAKGISKAQYRFEPVTCPPFAVKGTLQSWQENIGVHLQQNPMLLAIACIFIASPFLKALGLGTRLVNIYGPKGTGKTSCSQCAATIWGNGIDPAAGLYSQDEPYVTKFATTSNGLEPLLARYSPLPIALDELTEQAIALLGDLIYKLASGEGKHRMTAQMQAAPANRWLLTIVSTSESSVADAARRSGKPLVGGQADRAIDILIERVEVISNYGDFTGFQKITGHLKKACGEHYGTAGQAILQYAVDHPDEVSRLLSTAEEVEDRLLPPNCGDGERRVVKFLASAVAAGQIAIAAGVLTCDAVDVEAAVQMLVDEWWHGRGGSLQRIAEFLHANEPDVALGAPALRTSAKAFIDGSRVIIPDYVFDSEFGDEANGLVNELWGLNALVREQQKRNKHRFCNNRLYAYVINYNRVEPILLELAERDDAAGANAPIANAS